MRARRQLIVRALGLVAVLVLVAAGCGDDDDDGTGAAQTTTIAAPATSAAPETAAAADTTTTASPATTTTAAAEPLRILVTNDDGVGAPGIDALVQALVALPDTEIVVVAPAESRTLAGSSVTDGELVATDTTTASGYPATAIAGFPADSVLWALDNLPDRPHLVVSGINSGHNIGPISRQSGTVGAARTAALSGIPGLALSQGIAEEFDFPAGVEATLSWLADNRDALLAGTESVPAMLVSINVPSCMTGEVRGTVEVPVATDFGDRDAGVTDCESTLTDPADDVDAYNHGFVGVVELDPVADFNDPGAVG